jgi:hypothetical protein
MEGSGDVRSGSFSTEMGSLLDVRFPPVSDQTGDIAGGPFRANRRHHSITSSARSSNLGGISSPSAFAVFTLMTNWNLVG